jgi:hypothetical protein
MMRRDELVASGVEMSNRVMIVFFVSDYLAKQVVMAVYLSALA